MYFSRFNSNTTYLYSQEKYVLNWIGEADSKSVNGTHLVSSSVSAPVVLIFVVEFTNHSKFLPMNFNGDGSLYVESSKSVYYCASYRRSKQCVEQITYLFMGCSLKKTPGVNYTTLLLLIVVTNGNTVSN